MFLEIQNGGGMNVVVLGFSILFGSMFLEIYISPLSNQFQSKFQYPLWIDVFGNNHDKNVVAEWVVSFSILFGSMFLEISIIFENDNSRIKWFQYPLWIDVFGNPPFAVAPVLGQYLFQYPLWIDVFGNSYFVQVFTNIYFVSVSSLDRCFWK